MSDTCHKNVGKLVKKHITQDLKKKVDKILNDIPCDRLTLTKEFLGGAGDDENLFFGMTKPQWIALVATITPAVTAIVQGFEYYDLQNRQCSVIGQITGQILASGHCRAHQAAIEAAVGQCINNILATGAALGTFAWMFSKKTGNNNTTGGRKTKTSIRKSRRARKSRRERR